MKTLKIRFLKSVGVLFLGTFLFSACGQPNKATQAKTAMPSPKVDLHTAVISGDLEAVRQHIEAGSDLNEKEPFGGSTPLASAATFGKTAIAEALIEAGADLGIKNKDGATPLHIAAFFCRVEIVQRLIDADADKTLLNNYGATPRQTVMGPFEEVRPIYEMLRQQLAPMGFQLDMEQVERARPVVAMMLQ